MFQKGSYDVITFTPPIQGMNINISGDVLPRDFAQHLENLIPRIGELSPRFGTAEEFNLNNTESTILQQFSFIAQGNIEQDILFVQEYKVDSTADEFNLINNDRKSFSFTTTNSSRFVKDTPIKLRFLYNGEQTIYDTISNVTVQGTTVTITLAKDFLPTSVQSPVFVNVSYSTGTLYKYDIDSKTVSNPLRENLTVGSVIRTAFHVSKLFLCNGVDRLLVWDGQTLNEVYDFVGEKSITPNRIDNTHLSFASNSGININDYAAGRLIQIRVTPESALFQTTIVSSSIADNTLTITVQDNLPQFQNPRTIIFYQAFPPHFNYLFSAYGRLWALGPGRVGIEFREPEQALRVYCMYRSDSATDWFNELTKAIPQIDLSVFHNGVDNLEAITMINGKMIFVGRESTQIWNGTFIGSSSTSGTGIALSYESTIDTGIVHGDLIINLPNDVYFITKTGVQSVGSLNVAKQLAATSYNAVDPIVRDFVQDIYSSNVQYRACRSFKYNNGGFVGFKIGKNKILCSSFDQSLYAWTYFSGDFLNASSFLSLGNSLYLSIKNKIYKYADGADGSKKLYADKNNTCIIQYIWELPVVNSSFACKRYELQVSIPSSYTIDQRNKMYLEIIGDEPNYYKINSDCRFDLRGDAFGTIPFTSDNPPTEDSIGFRFAQPYVIYKEKFKFMASRFLLSLRGVVRDGPVTIRQLKLYGIIERN